MIHVHQVSGQAFKVLLVAAGMSTLAGAAQAQFTYSYQNRYVNATSAAVEYKMEAVYNCGGEPYGCGAPRPEPVFYGKYGFAKAEASDFGVFEPSVLADAQYVKSNGELASGQVGVSQRSELATDGITLNTSVTNNFSGNVLGYSSGRGLSSGQGHTTVVFSLDRDTELLISLDSTTEADLSQAFGVTAMRDTRSAMTRADNYFTLKGNGFDKSFSYPGSTTLTLSAGQYQLDADFSSFVGDPVGRGSVSWMGQFSIKAVPEPSTVAFMGLGLMAIGLVARQHRSKSMPA
jgi:PEP-CTERM motif